MNSFSSSLLIHPDNVTHEIFAQQNVPARHLHFTFFDLIISFIPSSPSLLHDSFLFPSLSLRSLPLSFPSLTLVYFHLYSLLLTGDWWLRVPLCYLMLEGRKDPSKVGLMYLCTFTLLKLSGERSFGVCLNQPYVLTLPVDVPPFSGMCD